MPVIKRVLCPQRLRQVPSQFSWIDHRLVRDRHIGRCSHQALALYLFLITVCDGQGLSYWSDVSVMRLLRLDQPALLRARQELISARLIAYQCPLYQVLALDSSPQPPESSPVIASHPPPAPAPQAPRQRVSQPMDMGQILRQMMEQTP
jgi:hypothetical protein